MEKHAARRTMAILAVCVVALACVVAQTPARLARAQDAPVADAPAGVHVSAFDIRSTVDGTGPFDKDDEPGNDSSESNGVCRSFDTVSYTLGYVTALDDATHMVSSARIRFSATLDKDPHMARFETSAMSWVEDPVTTYTYSDGSMSTTWDKTKTVTRQQLVAYRTLRGQSTDDRVPGAGQLSVTLRILAAGNGDTIQPTFSVACVGSEGVQKQVTPDPITVSAKLKLDLRYEGGATESARNPLYIDDAKNTWSLMDTDPANTDKSRIYAFGIGVCLYNDTPSKGMRGLELPQGDITFDIRNTCTLNGQDVTHGSDYHYLLWDWRDDDAAWSPSRTGRQRMVTLTSSQWAWEKNLPLNNGNPPGSDLRHAAYHGGHFTIVPDADDSALLHVTLSGYDFDWDDWSFPKTHGPATYTTVNFPDNELYFSTLILQNAVIYPRTVESTMNYMADSKVENLHATSRSGETTTEMGRPSWRKEQNNKVVLYQPGSFVSRTYWYCHNEATTWGSGRTYAALSDHPTNQNSMTYDGTDNVQALDHLFKFDTEDLALQSAWTATRGPHDEREDITLLYAAKTDGTGWTDFKEQRQAKPQNLVYYRSYDDLEAAGKTCVAVLVEIRDTSLISFRDYIPVSARFDIRPTATPGYVAISTHDTYLWTKDANPGSVLDHQNADGSYGLVDPSTDPDKHTGYRSQPNLRWEPTSYEPTRYENGTMVGEHTNGVNYGDSLLLVGDRTSIAITTTDQAADGSAKAVYDLDAGQRTATVKVSPKAELYSKDSSGSTASMTDDVTVTVTLPKGTSYVDGSASMEPVSKKPNADGTTTLTFLYENHPVADPMEPITLGLYIGSPGTDHDATNNEEFTIRTQVTSKNDPTASADPSDPHKSSWSFRVIRLAALSIGKEVSRAVSNPNEPFDWTLRVANTSQTDAEGAAVADVLPHGSDGRGTSTSMVMTDAGALHAERLASVSVDFSHAPNTLARARGLASVLTTVTQDPTVPIPAEWAVAATSDRPADGRIGSPYGLVSAFRYEHHALSDAALADGVATFDVTGAPGAIYLALGDLCAHEYVTVTLRMCYPDGGERSGDVQRNQFVEDSSSQPAAVISNVVEHRVEDVRLQVAKVWQDESPTHPYRPDSVTAKVTGTDGSTRDLALDAAHDWKASLALPAFDAAGERVTYTVSEDWSSPEYDAGVVTGDQASGFTITNRATTRTLPLTGSTEALGWLATGVALVAAGMATAMALARRR